MEWVRVPHPAPKFMSIYNTERISRETALELLMAEILRATDKELEMVMSFVSHNFDSLYKFDILADYKIE